MENEKKDKKWQKGLKLSCVYMYFLLGSNNAGLS